MSTSDRVFGVRAARACAWAALFGCMAAATTAREHSEEEFEALGKPASKETIAAADITIAPDGSNLPEGSGTAEQGKAVYAARCASCHGSEGQGGEGLADPLVGGIGSLATDAPVKTVGSYWPYATTLFDYTRRAMPLDAPLSLSDDEVYAVSAYILALNGIIGEDAVMNAESLAKVEMPNRNGFVSKYPGYTH